MRLVCAALLGWCSVACDASDDAAEDGAGSTASAATDDDGGATPSGGSTAPDSGEADTSDPSGTDPSGPDPDDGNPQDGDADTGNGDAADTTDDGTPGDETAAPPLDECLALADAVVFDNTPPRGETRVPGLGQCVELLDGEQLWNYHCMWCHDTLDNNDINERTLEKVWWGVDLSESLGNWPLGGLSDYPEAVESIYEAVLASPEPTVDQHPHPLPEYE